MQLWEASFLLFLNHLCTDGGAFLQACLALTAVINSVDFAELVNSCIKVIASALDRCVSLGPIILICFLSRHSYCLLFPNIIR